jgi:predicted nucleic acid-binding protein
MSGYVVDATVVMKWFIDEPLSRVALALRSVPLHAPDLLLSDCITILARKSRQGELTDKQVDEAADLLSRAAIDLHPSRPLFERSLILARDTKCPVRGCLYLATAWLLELPLVTADAELIEATRFSSLSSTTVPTVTPLATLAAR